MLKNCSWMLGCVLCLAAWSLPDGPGRADYEAGRIAWEEGRHADGVSQWEAAAAAGDDRAMLALGRAYRRGIGVPQDYVEAHKWLNLAAGLGDVEAARERDGLAREMTPEDRSEAMRLVREWQARGERRAGAADDAEGPAAASPAPPPERVLIEAQELLRELGHDPGTADGIWGQRSAGAYRDFLRKRGMPPAAVLSPEGLRALRAAAKEVRGPTAGDPPVLAPDLHQLVNQGDIEGLTAALNAGGNQAVNARDPRGWTPLMHAANKGYGLAVRPLLEAGAEPDVRGPDGATALFIAALHGHSEVIAMLTAAGADPMIAGPQGKTVVELVRARFGGYYQAEQAGEDSAIVDLLKRDITVADVLALMEDKIAGCGEFRFDKKDSDYFYSYAYSVEMAGTQSISVSTRTTTSYDTRVDKFVFSPADVEEAFISDATNDSYVWSAGDLKFVQVLFRSERSELGLYACREETALAIARSLTRCFGDPLKLSADGDEPCATIDHRNDTRYIRLRRM